MNGNFIWARQGNSTNVVWVGEIATSRNGNIYISGDFNGDLNLGSYFISSTHNPSEIFIACYNKSGDCLGTLQLGNASFGKMTADNIGNVFISA